MIKNIAIGLICLSIVLLIGLNIHQHQKIKDITQGVSTQTLAVNNAIDQGSDKQALSSKMAGQSVVRADNQKKTGNNEIDELNYHLDAAQEELALVNDQLAKNKAKKEEAKKAQVELQKKYRDDPAYKKSMKDSMAKEYEDLFKKLKLSPEKADKFKDLLVSEMMAQQDIYLESGADDYSTLTKEQQDELNKRYEALNKEYESKKADLLGASDYKTYQSYSESMGERYYVTSFMGSLSQEELLTDTQKDDLIEAMNEEARNIVYERSDDDESSAMYDEKSIARALKYQDQRGEAYLKAANDILSAAQIEKFKAYLKKEQDEFKLYMEMASIRYGTGAKKADTEDQ